MLLSVLRYQAIVDVLAALVIAWTAAGWFTAYHAQNRYTGTDFTSHLGESGADCVYLPLAMRKEAVKYLKQNLQVLSYDPQTFTPQQLSHPRCNYFLVDNQHAKVPDERVYLYSKLVSQIGSIELRRVNLGDPKPILRRGQKVVWEYTRPFIYTPLFPALELGPGSELLYKLYLGQGTYRIEAIIGRRDGDRSRDQSRHFQLLVDTPFERIKTERYSAALVAEGVQTDFLHSDSDTEVSIILRADSDEDPNYVGLQVFHLSITKLHDPNAY